MIMNALNAFLSDVYIYFTKNEVVGICLHLPKKSFTKNFIFCAVDVDIWQKAI